MKKGILFISFLSLTAILHAQPRCFIVGPAYSSGKASIENYSFTRNYVTTLDGAPSYEFSNFGNAEVKSKGVGIMMDIYTKRSRIAFDLMYPLKNSPGNPANFNLAFGGYIKGKIGILVGVSSYGNRKMLNGAPSDPTYTSLSLIPDQTATGNFYNDNFVAKGVGLNALFNIALNETTVIRFDYGVYATDIVGKKEPLPETMDWKQTSSRKFEVGLAMQVPGEPFGFSFKFVNWNTTAQYFGDYEYTNNGSPITATVEVFPERKYSLKTFMIALMIPLGSATSTTTTITVL
jgi:hypothetical protein